MSSTFVSLIVNILRKRDRIKMFRLRALILWVIVLLVFTAHSVNAQPEFVLPNPSFEEDYENDGIPDHWEIPRGAVVELTADRVTDGVKAAKFTDGYAVLAYSQKLEGLAGHEAGVAFDVAGDGGAKLGVIVAYNHRRDDGTAEFVYHRLTWDRVLKTEYQRVTLPLKFSENAIDGKVWFGIYRSNKTGTLYLDNCTVVNGQLTAKQEASLIRIQREWTYLHENLQSLDLKADLADEQKQAVSVIERAKASDRELLVNASTIDAALQQAWASTFNFALGGQTWAVRWSHPMARLDPAAVIPAQVTGGCAWPVVRGAYDAMAVNVWNAKQTAGEFAISLEGLDAAADDIVVRRQVFMENWYDRERQRVADPLTRLGQRSGQWVLPVEPGEVVKLYIGFRAKSDIAGKYPVQVIVADSQGVLQTVDAVIEVLPVSLPTEQKLAHWQCVYMNLNPADRHPELAAKDLAAHYVTSVQFPYAPVDFAEFDSQGHLLSYDFEKTRQSRWMRAYAPHIDKLWIFWEGTLTHAKLKDRDGHVIEPIGKDGAWTPAYVNAFSELLRAWLDYADEQGFGVEHWAIVPDDEPRSGQDWERAPGPAIDRAIAAFKLVREVEPELEIQVTMTDYALPADVQAFLPYVDVALPIYPYRDHLVRWAPTGYNPQSAYPEQIHPLLQQRQRTDGLTVWSYKVSRGIKDDPLTTELMYPVQAVARGYTGIGYWAYNVDRGQSWDDRDGGLLDYSFIYNGEESHSINQRYNVTGEIIVPSIRWELLRIGHQHGQILLDLKRRLDRGTCTDSHASDIQSLLASAEAFSPLEHKNDQTTYDRFVVDLLRTYVAVVAED